MSAGALTVMTIGDGCRDGSGVTVAGMSSAATVAPSVPETLSTSAGELVSFE